MSDQASRKKILDYYQKSEEDLAEDTEIIKKWLTTQKHLPEMPSDKMITFFIVINKFSLEKTKQRIDMYYTIRSHIPSVFEISNPKTPQMQACLDIQYSVHLPKLVDNMYQVHLIKPTGYIPNNFDVDWWIASVVANALEIAINDTFILGEIVIFDQQNLKLDHVIRLTPMHIKKMLAILETSIGTRVREFHFVNYPPILQTILKMVKPVIKPKMYNKFRFHQSYESLAEYVPMDILPKDYGGSEKSIEELHEERKKALNKYQDRFDKLDTLRVNESLRQTPLEDVESFGVQGTFKKLNVD